MGLSGGRPLHCRPSRKGDGGYQGPGWGGSGGTELSRRSGNSGNRGGAYSHRMWDGGGRIKSQAWPKPEAAEQRRRQKSWDGSEPEAAVQRKR